MGMTFSCSTAFGRYVKAMVLNFMARMRGGDNTQDDPPLKVLINSSYEGVLI